MVWRRLARTTATRSSPKLFVPSGATMLKLLAVLLAPRANIKDQSSRQAELSRWSSGSVATVLRQGYSLRMTRSAAALAAAILAACGSNHTFTPPSTDTTGAGAFLDTLQLRTFGYFWDLTNPANALTPDRSPTPSFSSIAAVGYALTAYPIGAERGYVSRAAARARVL